MEIWGPVIGVVWNISGIRSNLTFSPVVSSTHWQLDPSQAKGMYDSENGINIATCRLYNLID